MHIVAALFIDDIEMRQAPGPSTRIDLLGVQFSAAAPSPPPFTWAAHLCVLVYCPPDHRGTAALETTFWRNGEQVARNAAPLVVEPGKFTRQLVRPEIEIDAYGMIEAHCSIDLGPPTIVPYTLLPPVA
ncbi:MAG: hypothetical protein ACKVWR_21210 [Acidimicrobiales bacterium]